MIFSSFSTAVIVELPEYTPTEGETLSVCIVLLGSSVASGMTATVTLDTEVPPGSLNPAGTCTIID